MSSTSWQVLWLLMLAGGVVGMAGLLLLVSSGAIRELRQTLDELKASSDDDV